MTMSEAALQAREFPSNLVAPGQGSRRSKPKRGMKALMLREYFLGAEEIKPGTAVRGIAKITAER